MLKSFFNSLHAAPFKQCAWRFPVQKRNEYEHKGCVVSSRKRCHYVSIYTAEESTASIQSTITPTPEKKRFIVAICKWGVSLLGAFNTSLLCSITFTPYTKRNISRAFLMNEKHGDD